MNMLMLRISKNRLSLISMSIATVIVLFSVLEGTSSLLEPSLDGVESIDYLAFAENQSLTVIIPRGAANPEVDITKLSPTQWYIPSQISVNQNDTVTWINRDTEVHTVTTGIGAGLESLLNNKQGIKNGIFDTGIFKPDGNWTYKFVNPGIYQYFCTVHPWMEGMVVVKKGPSPTIPNYPVDASGQRQSIFPVHILTKDSKHDIDMAWSPTVLLAG